MWKITRKGDKKEKGKSTRRKKALSCLVVGVVLMSAVPWMVAAELPPELIEEKNRKAEEVFVGTVLGIYNAPSDWIYPHENSERLKYFNLEIKEIQKTTKGLEKGAVVKVVFVDYELKSGSEVLIGTTPVRINSLERIKIYVNPTDLGDTIFEPAIEGYSIEHLGYNYYYLMILGTVIGIIIGSICLIIKIMIRKIKINGGKNYEEN